MLSPPKTATSSATALTTATLTVPILYLLYRCYTVYHNIQHAKHYRQYEPTCILVCGGDEEREVEAIKLMQQHISKHNMQRLDLLVSSGCYGLDDKVYEPLRAARPLPVVILDHTAVDTVTNFTSCLRHLRAHRHHHVLLLTSAYHMPRAHSCSKVILEYGSGIAVTTYACAPTVQQHDAESTSRRWRDVLRSVVWLLTGMDGRWLNWVIHRQRCEAAERNGIEQLDSNKLG